MYKKQSGAAVKTLLITLILIGAFMGIAIKLLPKGFNHDTSVIGKGSPVAVLAHDKNSVYSLNLMDMLSQVRADYDAKLTFLVVDGASNEGRVFIQQQQANPGELLLFDKNGNRLEVLINIKDANVLRAALDDVFFK